MLRRHLDASWLCNPSQSASQNHRSSPTRVIRLPPSVHAELDDLHVEIHRADTKISRPYSAISQQAYLKSDYLQ